MVHNKPFAVHAVMLYSAKLTRFNLNCGYTAVHLISPGLSTPYQNFTVWYTWSCVRGMCMQGGLYESAVTLSEFQWHQAIKPRCYMMNVPHKTLLELLCSIYNYMHRKGNLYSTNFSLTRCSLCGGCLLYYKLCEFQSHWLSI